jgi:hypothetical protein
MEGTSFKNRKLTAIILAAPFFFLQSSAHPNDATQEINALIHEQLAHKDATEQVVLGTFANMVQNFFNIVQDPHNKPLVVANISQMLAGIVNVAVEVMKNFPFDASEQERTEFIQKIELALKTSLHKLARAQKGHLKTDITI